MIRQELVAEEKWVTPQHFNRVLAMYQVLPGPEAHELCVYFGMLSRGRIGGILAGLGFMLPGFMLVSLRDHVSCGRRAYVLAKQGLTSLVVAGTAVAGFALRFVSM